MPCPRWPVVLVGFAILAPAASARQQPAGPAPAPARDTSREQQALDELRMQAREDLTIWEARLKSRQSWLREASRRAEIAKTWRDYVEKRHKQGYDTAATMNQAELEFDEYTARRDQKAVEVTEAEVKAARLRRRVAMLDRADKYDVLDGPAASEWQERVTDLESLVDRLRAELDEVRQKPRSMQAERTRPPSAAKEKD